MNTIIFNSHILVAGILLACLVFAIIFLLQKPFSKERLGNIRAAINIGTVAIVIETLTGGFLFADRPQTGISTVLFWAKIALYVLDIILGSVWVNRKLQTTDDGSSSRPTALIVWTVVNILLTIGVIIVSIAIPK